MRMQQTQEQQINKLMLRVFWYIVKPFQITKVLELLYALNWLWYTLLSLLPKNQVIGPIMQSVSDIKSWIISTVFMTITIISFYGLWKNIIFIRKTMLIFNIAVVLYLFSRLAFQIPIVGTAGYLFILAGLSMFSFWRMDTREY